MDDDEDEVPTCPLCLEELDTTDRAVNACQCGYQVCLWCLHHIREQLSARCPACRTPYVEQNFKFAEVNPEQAAKEAKERATAKKERERREKLKEVERERARAALVSQQKAKNNLKHARILQRNLVYVIGLSLTLAREEVIRRADMFGKFGRIMRVLINRTHPFNADAPGGPSISAYVQYMRDVDASAAVRAMNNAVFDGREIRSAIATTKYCDVFVRTAAAADPSPTTTQHCGNPQCMYYHTIAPPELVLTREEVLARQLGPPPPSHLFIMDLRRGNMPPTQFQRPGMPQSGPLPIAAAPNTAVSGAASAVPANRAISTRASPTPGSAIPIGSASMMSSVQASTAIGTAIPSNASALQSNGGGNHPPLASSPRGRSGSAGSGRKPTLQPRAASPAASPQRTPPSSPGPRRPLPRLGMSPVGADSASGSAIATSSSVTSGGPGTTTATSAPFMSSSSANNPHLPSTAGWASSHQGRSTSRSPSRRGPSLDDPSRSRPRIQIRRRESHAPPPGFEDSSMGSATPAPARPPGFDVPGANSNRAAPARSDMPRPTNAPSMSGSPPPGFGSGVSSAKESSGHEASATNVAAAWSQEASTDEVFSTNERRARRPVGIPPQATPQEVDEGMDSRAELAQVLAKIGGDLGVSSEFQDVKNGPGVGMLGVVDGSGPQPGLGSLFADQSYRGGYGAQPTTNSSQREQGGPTQLSSYGSAAPAFPSAPGRSTPASKGAEVLPTRRNTSRFNFARGDVPEGRIQGSSVTNSLPRPSALPVTSSSLLIGADKREAGPGANGMRTESHVIGELTRRTGRLHPVAPPGPQPSRQSRSRFDFVDQSPSMSSQDINNRSMESVAQSSAAADGEPANDAFGATFANLSTAEKLASIFSSAQWSGERLPPMPTYDQQMDELAGQGPDHDEVPQGVPRSAMQTSAEMSVPASVSTAIEDRTRPLEPTQPQSLQYAPPGFREATPGITPESTAVDVSSATSGVAATSVASGVATGAAQTATSGQTEESLSSETESLEEDRKRSRAQRKREKKVRHLKEAAERKAVDAEVSSTVSTALPNEDSSTKAEGLSKTAASPGLREIRKPAPGQILSKPNEVKQMKASKMNDDPGRFMSVSELEREVEAARVREAQLQDRLLELQRRIRSYDNVRT